MTIYFLRALQKEFGESLIVVLDYPPYCVSKKVRKFAAEAGIDICYLRRYSPQMNLVEECWRQLEHRLDNLLFDNFEQLNETIREALGTVNPPNIYNYLSPSR